MRRTHMHSSGARLLVTGTTLGVVLAMAGTSVAAPHP
jgi:hypothetical protein